MNAAVVNTFDAPPRYGTFTDPVAAEGEVIVEVMAAGLHPIVKSLANGTHYGSTEELPFIPGVDGVGRLEDGTAVYFGLSRKPFGTFAERAVTARKMCLPLPAGLDPVTAAAIANPGMSSSVALEARARFVPGESVLILGATGVAGQLAVQIAKRKGARRVVAAGRDAKALAKLMELGATSIVSLDGEPAAWVEAFRREWAAGGVDVVLDYLWGPPAEALLEAISQKGLQHAGGRIRYMEIGSIAGSAISLAGATLRSSGLELLGSGFGSASVEQIWQVLAEFFQSAAEEPFQLNVKTAALGDVEALWNSDERGARLVFEP
jgi:NADPH:quinone reductase-like Zn-dependent oxidoreductase